LALAAAAIVMAASGAPVQAKIRWYAKNVRPIPVIYGDYMELALRPEVASVSYEGYPHHWAAAYVDVPVIEGEALAIGYVTDVAGRVMLLREDAGRDDQFPGYADLVTYGLDPGKSRFTNFRVYTGKGGTYRMVILPNKTGQPMNLKLWVFRWPSVPPDERASPFGTGDYRPKPGVLEAAMAEAARTRRIDPATAVAGRRPSAPVPAAYIFPLGEGGQAFVQDKAEALRPFYAALHADGEQNAVANFAKLGLAAMENARFATAEWAFDEALRRIETIYAKDAAAVTARSKWAAESFKDFKGEPYERSMAYYYRGLLYLRRGDYENARASFAQAEYQDTLSEAEEYRSDFGLMNFLAGWAARCGGATSLAADSFAIAAGIDPALKAPPPAANLLILSELGRGPVKVARGGADQLLGFALSERQGLGESVRANGAALPVAGDVVFQAMTRGGRPVDAVLRGKVSFQNNSGSVAGLLQGAVSAMPLLAIPTIAVGALSARTETRADIRQWDSLPGRIALGTMKAGKTDTLAFTYAAVDEPTRAAPWMSAWPGRCGIAWSRAHSAIAAGAGVPGNDKATAEQRARKTEQAGRDAAFRSALAAQAAKD
jgi:tetratricopeptide (TPR) repeat protein